MKEQLSENEIKEKVEEAVEEVYNSRFTNAGIYNLARETLYKRLRQEGNREAIHKNFHLITKHMFEYIDFLKI